VPTVSGVIVHLPGRDISLCVRDWGGSGPPVLLLHGLASNSRIWDLTAPLLATGFHVIAVDLRGHGQSDRPEDAYGFADTTADLSALLPALGVERPFLAGHSWGASVALDFAAAQPGVVTALALVDGGFIQLADRLPWEEAERIMRPPNIDGVPLETFLGFMRNWPQFRDSWNDDLADMFLSNFEVRDEKVYRRLPIPQHMQIARAIYDFRARDLLARLPCPAFAISCHREPSNEAERQWQSHRSDGLERLSRQAPWVRVHVMEHTIHDVPVQRPAELAGLLAAFFRSVA
jgi:pimeloyl-ACP methyl ester carboxylesterase